MGTGARGAAGVQLGREPVVGVDVSGLAWGAYRGHRGTGPGENSVRASTSYGRSVGRWQRCRMGQPLGQRGVPGPQGAGQVVCRVREGWGAGRADDPGPGQKRLPLPGTVEVLWRGA